MPIENIPIFDSDIKIENQPFGEYEKV